MGLYSINFATLSNVGQTFPTQYPYPDETDIPLDALIAEMASGLLTMSDHEYLAKLDECLEALYG